MPYVLGHYWRGGSRWGSLPSIVFGCGAVVVVQLEVVTLWGLDPILVGIAVSLLASGLALALAWPWAGDGVLAMAWLVLRALEAALRAGEPVTLVGGFLDPGTGDASGRPAGPHPE